MLCNEFMVCKTGALSENYYHGFIYLDENIQTKFWQVICYYNPPINFRVILLATLRHLVQNHWTVITQ